MPRSYGFGLSWGGEQMKALITVLVPRAPRGMIWSEHGKSISFGSPPVLCKVEVPAALLRVLPIRDDEEIFTLEIHADDTAHNQCSVSKGLDDLVIALEGFVDGHEHLFEPTDLPGLIILTELDSKARTWGLPLWIEVAFASAKRSWALVAFSPPVVN